MNLNKLLVRELKDLYIRAGLLNEDEMSTMTKAELVEFYTDADPVDQATIEAAFEGVPAGNEGDDLFLSMEEILAEVRAAADDAVKSNKDIQKVKAFLKKAVNQVDRAEREKEFQELLAKAKIPTQAVKPLEIIIKPPVGKNVKVNGIAHKVFPEVLELASQRKPVFLTGPSGCGKTHLAGMVHEALKSRKFGSISCSVGMSESHLQGKLIPIGEGGRFVYVGTDFVDIVENGGVFLIDEIDSGDENMLVTLNMLLANGIMPLPQRVENPVVKMHEDAIILAAANTYGNGADAQYVGRNQLDAATMDRFRTGFVEMDYDRDVERALASEDILEWGWDIRDRIQRHGIQRIMSTRTLRDMTHMAKAYPETWGKQRKWDAVYFADWSKDERQTLAG